MFVVMIVVVIVVFVVGDCECLWFEDMDLGSVIGGRCAVLVFVVGCADMLSRICEMGVVKLVIDDDSDLLVCDVVVVELE